MLIFFILLALVLLVLAGIGTGIYNNLVALKNTAEKEWKNIDVVLLQRHDELPKLVDTCRGYMKHEQSVLENVVRLRSAYAGAGRMDDKLKIENELARQLSGLKLVWERYPDLKANQNFMKLLERITSIEARIADYRESFNDAVNRYNIRTETFPENIIAGMFRFGRLAYLETPEASKQDVKINL